jgi:hypothetical protein
MKSSTFGIMMLMIVLLALSLSVPFAEDDCPDLRACVENCSEIQNCSAYLKCIENCTLNATSDFGEAKGYCAGSGCLGLGSRELWDRNVDKSPPIEDRAMWFQSSEGQVQLTPENDALQRPEPPIPIPRS